MSKESGSNEKPKNTTATFQRLLEEMKPWMKKNNRYPLKGEDLNLWSILLKEDLKSGQCGYGGEGPPTVSLNDEEIEAFMPLLLQEAKIMHCLPVATDTRRVANGGSKNTTVASTKSSIPGMAMESSDNEFELRKTAKRYLRKFREYHERSYLQFAREAAKKGGFKLDIEEGEIEELLSPKHQPNSTVISKPPKYNPIVGEHKHPEEKIQEYVRRGAISIVRLEKGNCPCVIIRVHKSGKVTVYVKEIKMKLKRISVDCLVLPDIYILKDSEEERPTIFYDHYDDKLFQHFKARHKQFTTQELEEEYNNFDNEYLRYLSRIKLKKLVDEAKFKNKRLEKAKKYMFNKI